MNYNQFKEEAIKWAKERNIQTKEGMGDHEILCFLHEEKVCILLCKDWITEEGNQLVEFRIGNEQEGFSHTYNIYAVEELEEVIQNEMPVLLNVA